MFSPWSCANGNGIIINGGSVCVFRARQTKEKSKAIQKCKDRVPEASLVTVNEMRALSRDQFLSFGKTNSFNIANLIMNEIILHQNSVSIIMLLLYKFENSVCESVYV